LDDGGWGAIANNFASALSTDATKQASIYLHGAQYQKLLLDAEEQKRKMAAVKAAVENYPNEVPIFPEGPAAPERQARLDSARKQQILDNAASSSLAKNAEDYAKGVFGTRAAASIAAGIPSSPAQQDVLQTYLSGSGMSLPNYATTPHTFQPLNAASEPNGPPVTSRRIPTEPSTILSPGKLGETNNPFENDPKMLQYLHNLQQRISAGGTITHKEAETAGIMMDRLHPIETEMKEVNGRLTPVPVRKKAVEAGFGRLAELADDYRSQFAPGAARANFNAAPVPYMGAGAGASLSAPSVPPAGGLVGSPTAFTAPPVAPIVSPEAGMRLGGGPQAVVGAPVSSINPRDFAKDATSNKLTYEYETVQQNWESMVQNLKVDSQAADVGIIFAAAKTLDPPSVVRGPEGEMLIRTGGIGDRLVGMLSGVQGGGRLTAAQRADLASMVQERAKTTEQVYFKQRGLWEQQGTQGGLTPEQINAHLPTDQRLTPFNIRDVDKYLGVQKAGGIAAYERLQQKQGTTGPPLARPPAARPAAAAPAGRTIKVNPDGTIVDVR
jgi:hypothetical protein